MSTNNTEEGSKAPTKPQPMKLTTLQRTVSAHPTLSEGTAGTDNKEGVKLNTNAPVFVPKGKRPDTTPVTTTGTLNVVTESPTEQAQIEQTEVKETLTNTTPIVSTGYPSTYQGQNFQNPQKNLAGTSYLPYTYMNPIYPTYSPNTRIPAGNFFPSNIMTPTPVPMNPQVGYQPYGTPYHPKHPQTNYNLGNAMSPTVVTNQPAITTPPVIDKKMVFNKDSKVFIPKSMRGRADSESKEGERKISIGDQNEFIKSPVKLVQTDNKTEEVRQTTETKEEKSARITEENKKKSKLTDFLESKDTKPAIATKTTQDNKKVVVTSTTGQSKNDTNKYIEEKRKLLVSQQKVQKEKPVTAGAFSKGKVERDTQKEEREQVQKVKADSPIPSDDEEDETPVSRNLERFYFIKEEVSKPVANVFSVDYLLSFRNWKICNEQKLLSNLLKEHLTSMSIYEDERPRGYRADKKKHAKEEARIMKGTVTPVEDKAFIRSSIKAEPQISMEGGSLGKWGRKDMSEAERIAQEFKTKFEEKRKIDPMKDELMELLNILTFDNYEEVKQSIFEKIKNELDDQKKFLEVLFKKAVSEKTFVPLYAKICKDLDKDMPQKSEKDARHSKMRAFLLDKCREIFKVDNAKVDQYIKVSDPEERETKMKKFLLGNVNFIGEIINSKLLSRKIVFQCIDNLFLRIEKAGEEQDLIKLINLEGIVILIDKIGTLIHKNEKGMKIVDFEDFIRRIDEYLDKLDRMQETDKSIPGYIRYKIINLIEKSKRGWEESKVDKFYTAKGMKEVREEHENEQRTGRGNDKLDQDTVNSRIRDDMYNFREHYRKGYPMEEYHWETVDKLLKKHRNSIAEIITAFGENCIDFVGKHDDIHTAYTYMKEIISFYSVRIEKKERYEILETTLFFLQNLNDFSLDNNLLVDVWGGVFYLLEFFKIFSLNDLDKLKDVNEDQLKTIFEVINQALVYYFDDKIKEEKKKELNNVNLIKANKALFQNIIES